MNSLESIESIASRLRKAMSLRGIKQIELSEVTMIPKSSINQYLSGYAEPKHDRIYKIAQALNVDPVWLMGMDVPMEKQKAELTEDNAAALADLIKDGRQFEYIKKINELSPEKKEALYSYIDFLNSTK